MVEKKKSKLEIRELEWGEGTGMILFLDPRRCPRCHSRDIRCLVYGLPAAELSEEEKEHYELGGCMVRKEEWHCAACGHDWPEHAGVILDPGG